ncbi:hypothetical protein HDU67_004298 [Dinochytrium kinnereticum]|nr:hypothetical protein HDU67_004298 [Dinochytrium kinnereticum]
MHRQLGRVDRSASMTLLKMTDTSGNGAGAGLSLAASNPPPSPQFDTGSSSSHSNERIRSVLQFEDCFWGNGEDPTMGVRTLNELIAKHLNEVEEIIVAIKQRIAIEEGYALRVAEFARVLQTFTLNTGFIGATTHHGMGFGGAVPYGGLGLNGGNGAVWGGHGIDHSSGGAGSTIDGASDASARRRSEGGDGASDLTQAAAAAAAASAAGVSAEKGAPGSGLYQSMEKPGGGATIDDESSLFPVARNWGKILHEMTACNRRHADTLLLAVLTPLQAFVSQHRRVMEKKRAEVDNHHRTVTKLYAEIAQKRNAYVTKSRHAAGPVSSGAGEEAQARANRDSEAAKVEYQQAITAAEHSRSALEFHITDFLMWAQETEYYRLKVAREAFLALESAQLFTVEAHTRLWTVDVDPEMAHHHGGGAGSSSSGSYAASSTASSDENAPPPLRLVTPSPSHGIENIAMRLRTGSRHTPPFVFEPYVANPSTAATSDNDAQNPNTTPRQAFGIPIDDLARATGDPIPAVVRKCVASLHESKAKQRLRSGLDAWIMPNPDLPSVHFLRLEFNSSLAGVRVGSARLARETPAVVAGVLKLFLVETPTSLCNYEIYDVLKIIYSAANQNGEEETMIRIKSVASLLTTLSPAHYETLKIFAGLMHETVKHLEPTDKRIRRLAYSISPCIIRPKKETSETLSDEHPYLLTMDLLLHFPDLLGGTLPLSYFEAPPTPPASPEPEDDDDVAPRGFGRLKASSNLNLRESALGEVGSVAGSAWRGLVKSVSNLNLRGGGGGGGGGNAGSAAGTVGVGIGSVHPHGQSSPVGASPTSANTLSPAEGSSSWFSWGRSQQPSRSGSSSSATAKASTPPSASLTSTTMVEEILLHEHDLDLDHDPDVGGEDMDIHPCHWAGCRAVLPSPESLIDHLRVEHMRVGVSGAFVGDAAAGGGGGGGGVRRNSKRSSAAVLPVLEDEEEEDSGRLEGVGEEEEDERDVGVVGSVVEGVDSKSDVVMEEVERKEE